jgi:predicted nucleic acid-binding protein
LERQERYRECGSLCQKYAEMERIVVIDTDVLIWYLKGNKNARDIINANIPFKISIINYVELIQGMDDKRSLNILKEQLKNWSVEVLHINENISIKAMNLVENYYLSHSLELADSVIAATVLENNEILITANDKHYQYIPDIQIKIFRPM